MQRSQIECGFVNIISRKETATLACSSTSTGATLNDPWLMIMSTTLANLHDQHHAHQKMLSSYQNDHRPSTISSEFDHCVSHCKKRKSVSTLTPRRLA